MEKLISLDEFTQQCGYFYNAYIEKNININNGYNCDHPEQEEIEKGIGRCHAWSCPLACEAREEDFQDPEIERDEYDTYEEGHFVVVEGREDKP